MAYKTKMYILDVEEDIVKVLCTSATLQTPDGQEAGQLTAPLSMFPRQPEEGDIFRGYLNEDEHTWEGIYEY